VYEDVGEAREAELWLFVCVSGLLLRPIAIKEGRSSLEMERERFVLQTFCNTFLATQALTLPPHTPWTGSAIASLPLAAAKAKGFPQQPYDLLASPTITPPCWSRTSPGSRWIQVEGEGRRRERVG